MTAPPRPLTSLLVGDAALTVQCAEILLARGQRIAGLITGDARVAGWAAERLLPCAFAPTGVPLTRAAVEALLDGTPIDLLFSLHNLRIVPAEVLALARHMAINYHDALLPRYAGLHATSWALRNRERTHGITWHRMQARIDAGEILLQRRFAIEPDETAWTLNARCAEAASSSFPELLTGLEQRSFRTTAQEPAARTWFPGWRLPSPGCVVPWGESAEAIAAFVRALDFGTGDNPMGRPKLLTPDGALAVPVLDVEILPFRSGAPAGTVLDSEGEWMTVASATTDVRVRLATETHRDARQGLRVGLRLPQSAPQAERLAVRERAMVGQAPTWRAHLLALSALAPAGFAAKEGRSDPADGSEGPSDEAVVALDLPVPVFATPTERAEAALAALVAFLALEIGEPFDVALGEPTLRREIADAGWLSLVETRPPLRIDLCSPLAPLTFSAWQAQLSMLRERHLGLGTYASDLPARLRRLGRPATSLGPTIAIDLLTASEDPEELRFGPETTLAIAISQSGERAVWRSRRTGDRTVEADLRLRALANRFGTWWGALDPAAELRGQARATVGTDGASIPENWHPAASLIELFDRQAQRDPQAVAIDGCGKTHGTWTYGALVRRVRRLASALRRRGVGPETVVAVRLPHLPDLVTALYAVLEAGGAFLVLDPLDPRHRQARILAEARPAILLGDPDLHRLAPEVELHPIALADAPEQDLAAAEAEAGRAPVRAATPTNLAYVAFTSGSTGTPKGVAIERRALDHYIEAAGRRFALRPGDRVLQIGSPAFDLAYEQIFGALAHGATLVALEGVGLPASADLFDLCSRRRITVLDLPTAVWEQLTRDLVISPRPLPPSLRLVVLGGEAAHTATARDWQRCACEGADDPPLLLNTYGPTEATIVATWWEAPAAPEALDASPTLPIGKPIPGTFVRLLDEARRPVSPGAPGELWLGGSGLARGYYRRPAWTAERFVQIDGERLFRTGDRVRERPDGELEFLGRLDRQVKIAGRRVEPGEVEAALLEIHGITEVRVELGQPREEADGTARLQAWVVLGAAAPTLEELRREIARRLPAPLRPSRITPVAALPLTAGGKIDRAALHGLAAPPPQEAADRPFNPVEARLATLWESLLGAGRLEPRDDFFTLGGDSLSSLALLAAIERTFGRRIPVAQLLRASTLEAMAREIQGNHGAEAHSLLVPLQPQGTGAPLYCVHGLGGHLLRLLPLARAFGTERPLLGFQNPGLDDKQPIPCTIEELAALYVGALRVHRTPGPHLLCGMSFGGIVALEMARQLAESGEETALVALFDSDLRPILPGFRPTARPTLPRWKERMRRRVEEGLGRGRRLARLVFARQDVVRKPNEYRGFTRVLRTNEAALNRYQLRPYSGRVVYFRATAWDAEIFEELVRWTGCQLEIVPMPGGHLPMLEPPHVAALAEELRRRIRLSI